MPWVAVEWGFSSPSLPFVVLVPQSVCSIGESTILIRYNGSCRAAIFTRNPIQTCTLYPRTVVQLLTAVHAHTHSFPPPEFHPHVVVIYSCTSDAHLSLRACHASAFHAQRGKNEVTYALFYF